MLSDHAVITCLKGHCINMHFLKPTSNRLEDWSIRDSEHSNIKCTYIRYSANSSGVIYVFSGEQVGIVSLPSTTSVVSYFAGTILRFFSLICTIWVWLGSIMCQWPFIRTYTAHIYTEDFSVACHSHHSIFWFRWMMLACHRDSHYLIEFLFVILWAWLFVHCLLLLATIIISWVQSEWRLVFSHVIIVGLLHIPSNNFTESLCARCCSFMFILSTRLF